MEIDQQTLKTVEGIVEHKKKVGRALRQLAGELEKRAEHHDDSKLMFPELLWLVEMDRDNEKIPYGTKEYLERRDKYKEFFNHHYQFNSHHPEHHQNGVKDMDLVDLVELVVDWCSYSKGLSVNEALDLVDKQAKRFDFGEEMSDVFKNTLINYFSWLSKTDWDKQA